MGETAMSEPLTFYTNPMSRGRIARWMLEEAACSYETVVLDYGTTMKGADYLAVNPMGKVPAIRHGSQVVTEGAAICAYLADAFPDAGLAPPPGNPTRAPYYRWLFFGAGPLEAAVTAKALGILAPADKSAMVGYGSYEDTLRALETAVSGAGPYLCGEQFTAADVYLGSQIGWGLQFGTVERRPAFEDYWARISDRDAYRRATEIDDALLAEAQSNTPAPGAEG
jgi:glutathione S-transferase